MRSAWECQPVGGHEVTWAQLSTRTVPVAPVLWQEPPTPALGTQSAGQRTDGGSGSSRSGLLCPEGASPRTENGGGSAGRHVGSSGLPGRSQPAGAPGGHPAQMAEPSDSAPSWTPPSPQPHPIPLPTKQAALWPSGLGPKSPATWTGVLGTASLQLAAPPLGSAW